MSDLKGGLMWASDIRRKSDGSKTTNDFCVMALGDEVLRLRAQVEKMREAFEQIEELRWGQINAAGEYVGFTAMMGLFNRTLELAAPFLAAPATQPEMTPGVDPGCYGPNDPVVTCPWCLKTFRCDPMDATCRLCHKPYDKSRLDEFFPCEGIKNGLRCSPCVKADRECQPENKGESK